MKNKSLKELVDRLNEIMVEKNNLDLEYNKIVKEIHLRMPHLKEDPSLVLKKVRSDVK